MGELILNLGEDLTDTGALLEGFHSLGWTVVWRYTEVGRMVGRFDGIIDSLSDRVADVRKFLKTVDRCRPEWFALDECLDVELDGYVVQRLRVGGRSLQFGHRSGWVLDASLLEEATPETVAMAIAERRPATEETASTDPAAVPGKRSKPVTIPKLPTNGFSGGKGGAGVWQSIVNQMPPHDLYVEGCLGRGGVMRNKRAADELSIGIESDGDVIRGHWKGFDKVPGLRVIEADVKAWLRSSFGVGYVPGQSHCVFCAAKRYKPAATPKTSSGSSPRCRQCDLVTLVYVDPPYLAETRKSNGRLYRDEWSTADHVELLTLLKQLPCYVLVSGYDSDLYRKFLAGWRVVTFEAMTRGGTKATEHLWCNFPAPDRLHDPRWLGADRRKRERWRRRADSMTRKLMGLSPLERQAVLDRVREGEADV